MYDLDTDPMTLAPELILDMVKMYHHSKNEVSVSNASKVIAQTDRQTDRPTHTDTDTDTHTDKQTNTHIGTTKTLPLPHTQEVKK